jgi:hypothetical protein
MYVGPGCIGVEVVPRFVLLGSLRGPEAIAPLLAILGWRLGKASRLSSGL